jgi:hypothetical protein
MLDSSTLGGGLFDVEGKAESFVRNLICIGGVLTALISRIIRK